MFDAKTNKFKRWSQIASKALRENTLKFDAVIGAAIPILFSLIKQIQRTIDTSIGQRYMDFVKVNLTINYMPQAFREFQSR